MKKHYNLYYILRQDCRRNLLPPRKKLRIKRRILRHRIDRSEKEK